jgi:hypothetical protein
MDPETELTALRGRFKGVKKMKWGECLKQNLCAKCMDPEVLPRGHKQYECPLPQE